MEIFVCEDMKQENHQNIQLNNSAIRHYKQMNPSG